MGEKMTGGRAAHGPLLPVQLHITAELLREMLRLPPGTEIAGASVTREGSSMVLYLDVVIPGQPAGAGSVTVSYARDDRPAPVTLLAVRWFRPDGTEIMPGDEG